MTNTKIAKRALISSAVALILCFSMLLGTTYAWFTDSVVSGNNKITAGNLDIELEYYTENGEWKTVNGATDLFDNTLWEPGRTEVVYLRLSNLGSLALKYELAINIVSETSGVNMAGEEFLLSDYIYMGVAEQEPEFASRSAAQTAVASKAGIISEGFVADGEMVKGADALYLAVVVYMPTGIGNEANYRGNVAPSIDLGINLIATQQMSEEDSFGSDYDKDAIYKISADEKVILNGNKFDNGVENLGEAKLNNIEINVNGDNAFYNEGTAELKDATLNMTGYTNYIAFSKTAGSVTIYDNVTATSSGGGINVSQGKAIFKSGTITTNSTSTSARHMFYVADGAELVIEDGEFFFNPTNLTRKGSYICAEANAKVIVKGGTFHKPSTRTAPIQAVSGATVEIYGGTFAFDPSTWVADGYKALKNGDNWYVVPESADIVVTNIAELQAAIANGGNIALVADITGVNANDTITVDAGKNVVLDLNGHKITATADKSGNQELFLVKGTMTVKNGALELTAANNQAWNAMATIFDVTAGGVLKMDDVTANVGGTDMNFIVHLNNWGSATLEVNNCDFTATYVAVRAFNSGYDMNTVTIKNTDFHTGRMFWVHNYTADGKDDSTLTLDIYGNGNTTDNAKPVRFGFSGAVYYDINGNLIP